MINFRTSVKPFTAAIAGAVIFATLSSHAAVTEENAKRVKPGYPLGTMAEWLANPTEFAWNPVNVRLGKHPDRSLGVNYIFKDEADANAWWDPTDPATPEPPDGIPSTAVAFVHWVMDNDSGTFPGIMSYSDIDGFKTRNCIMSSGAEIRDQGTILPKDCSNPQGSSKRFKMGVLKADTPVDLVFNVELAALTYKNYDTLPTFDGVEESARIYRVLQKWQNATGTDTVLPDGTTPVVNVGTRIVGFSSQLGYGVGDAFTPIADGTKLTDGLGYELRLCMPDQFFDVSRDPKGEGTNDCTNPVIVTDSTGQELRQEIWLENEYSTLSPKMYSLVTDKRTFGIGGFWDKNPSGINPPEIQTESLLDAGDSVNTLGYHGATRPNYYQLPLTQGAGAEPPIPGNVFGYLMPFGVFADGDPDIVAQGIYRDDDGDPETEGDLFVWWDGFDYRYGIDRELDGAIDADKFGIVPDVELAIMASRPLSETEVLEPPRYELGYMDDMAGLNVDTFVYLGREFDLAAQQTFTIRLVAQSVADAGAEGDSGNMIPDWVANPAPELLTFVTGDGIVTIDAGTADDPVDLMVIDKNVGGDDLPVTVTVVNARSAESETVSLVADDTGIIFGATLATNNSSAEDADNNGTMNIQPDDLLEARYIDADDGDGNIDVLKTATATVLSGEDELPPPSDDDSGWCSYNPNGRFDPVLPALVLIGLGYLGLRRKVSSSR